jgi:undecaprenyl-diphosphatase
MDLNILMYIQENLRNFILTPIFSVITYSGNDGIIWIIISLGLLIHKKTRFIGVLSFIVLLEVLLINNFLIKNYVARLRPFLVYQELELLISAPSGYSFTSGHSCASFASGVIFFRYLPKKYSYPIIVYATLVAFSRLYFGVHYPTDVLAGIALGTVFALFTSYVYEKYFKKDVI